MCYFLCYLRCFFCKSTYRLENFYYTIFKFEILIRKSNLICKFKNQKSNSNSNWKGNLKNSKCNFLIPHSLFEIQILTFHSFETMLNSKCFSIRILLQLLIWILNKNFKFDFVSLIFNFKCKFQYTVEQAISHIFCPL